MSRARHRWSDIEDLVGLNETARREFKRQPRDSEAVARQVAAMAAAGGEIYYGVEEHPDTGLVKAISGLEGVSKQEERMSQIIRSNIVPVPVPEVDVYAVHDPSSPGQGVLVVDVPRSENGPHMVDGRYPVRDGTTTRYLNHQEVQQHLALVASPEPSSPGVLLEDVPRLPGIRDERVTSTYEGYAQLRLAARPTNARLEHHEHPQLGRALRAALAVAERRMSEQLAIYSWSTFVSNCGDWTPEGTLGWTAGFAGRSLERLQTEPNAAALVFYPWRTTIELTMPTMVPAHRRAPAYSCAQEGKVAAELWTMLVFLAEFYAARDAVRLEIVLHLAGFAGAVSYHASHATEGMVFDHLPTATSGVIETVTVDVVNLASEPEIVARRLLARWLLPFYEGSDLLDYVLGRV